ncbi:hypothetical protein K3181_12070 [Qipengyuania sp. YG27]|uniref:Uncharacterized protein n=1 Tax=Qipengyuania mesophila TaxID=2867246 RepID=A0ABS7JX44_9SPHN|nr:hypothetical protein [Qipengyuania mesophila]MBX7502179.1 hypothetical protein [Qipengyuania mesophila]
MGLGSVAEVDHVSGHGYANIAVRVFHDDAGNASPFLLFPIDIVSSSDKSTIASLVARSIGEMVALEKQSLKACRMALKTLAPMFVDRGQATLERLDFLFDGSGNRKFHAELMLVQKDLSTVRCREVAEDVPTLVKLIRHSLIEHDQNMTVLEEIGSPLNRLRATSLAASVLDLIGLDRVELMLDINGDDKLEFLVADTSLPFASGSFQFEMGILQCSLAMRNQQCWFDKDRLYLANSPELPASIQVGLAGKPLTDFLSIEGLEFEAEIFSVSRLARFLVIELGLPQKTI